MRPPQLTVIGAGASGMFAAITAARLGCKVRILEATRQPMKKILKSGGGRCNVMHKCLETPRDLTLNYPRGRKELIGPYTTRFTQQETWDWFENIGVELKVEDDGRVFPITDSSETVATALRNAAEAAGVVLELGARVIKLEKTDTSSVNDIKDDGNKWKVTVQYKHKEVIEIIATDTVMLATGSSPLGYDLANSIGHTISKTMPSLFSFRLKPGHILEGLQGISIADVELVLLSSSPGSSLTAASSSSSSSSSLSTITTATTTSKQKKKKKKKNIQSQRGPLLITHRGISGPAALRLSSFAAADLRDISYQGELQLNCLPNMSLEDIRGTLITFHHNNGNKLVNGGTNSMYPFMNQIPRRLWGALVDQITTPNKMRCRWNELNKKELINLSELLVKIILPFKGKDTNKEEFVTAGGVDLKEIDLKRCESKKHKNLYFGGEVLNIDGVTGGFNFQSCWTTGFIVGEAVNTIDREMVKC